MGQAMVSTTRSSESTAQRDQIDYPEWQFRQRDSWQPFLPALQTLLEEKFICFQSNPEDSEASTVHVGFNGSSGCVNLEEMTLSSQGFTYNVRRKKSHYHVLCPVPPNWSIQSSGHFTSSNRQLLQPASSEEIEAVRSMLANPPHRNWTMDVARSSCPRMIGVKILECHRVENVMLWERYQFAVRDMKSRHEMQGITVRPVQPPLPNRLPRLYVCDPSVNEAIVMHGTSPEKAGRIVQHGFDERVSRMDGFDGYYGAGLYTTPDSCKAMQYCQGPERTLIIVMVACGDSYYALRTLHGQRRPPERSDGEGSVHDSAIANCGPMEGAPGNIQQHREIVVFNGSQTYPLYVVKYVPDQIVWRGDDEIIWDATYAIQNQAARSRTRSTKFTLGDLDELQLSLYPWGDGEQNAGNCSLYLWARPGFLINYTMKIGLIQHSYLMLFTAANKNWGAPQFASSAQESWEVSLKINSVEKYDEICPTVMRSTTKPHTVFWDFASAAKAKTFSRGEFVSSEPFTLWGLSKLQLIFYPKGDDTSEEGHCSLYLSVPPIAQVKFQLGVRLSVDRGTAMKISGSPSLTSHIFGLANFTACPDEARDIRLEIEKIEFD